MRRAAAIALAALTLAPSAVRAQFRARPMVIPVPSAETAVLAGSFVTAPGAGEPALADLLLARSGAAPSLRPHHALLAPLASSPVLQPSSFRCVAAGRLAENGGDDRADVVYCAGLQNELRIAFGDAPGVLRSYTHLLSTIASTPSLTFARLHPAPRRSDVIVLPVDTGRALPNEGDLYALDFGTSAGAPAMVDRSWEASGILTRALLPDEVLTIRISDGARARGMDDLYIPGFGSVTLYANATPAGASALSEVQLEPPVKVGGLDPSWWLPAGVGNNDVLGAGALDVDGDGDLDLVVLLAPSAASLADPRTPPGKLLWVERTGDLAVLGTTPWRDLGADPALQPLSDPALLRAIELGGAPALAVFDRGSDSVLVVTAPQGGGGLRVWRGGAAGRELRDLRLADVVGSPEPDLVADGTRPGLGDDPPGPAILVWPDLSDASPEIAWAPGHPGLPLRGEDFPLAVSARDPDGPFTVEWILGDPHAPPSAASAVPAGAAAVDVAWTLDGGRLCEPPVQTIRITARATDALGVFDDVSATREVGFAAPALAIRGAVPAERLELPPGGTAATLEGSAWTRCGAVAFTWGGSLLAAAASVAPDDGATTTRRILDLPESSYPALLAGEPVATLVATDPVTGLTSPTATLEVALDARDLVEAEHEADRVALAPGELTVVRTRLRNRTGVALPEVHVVDVLDGLAPAGAPRATGPRILRTLAGGAEIVLDVLPARGEAVIELPVRSLGGRGASAVEARSSGGHLLTRAASAAGRDPAAPGCGCGGGGADLGALLALAAIALWRRPARAAAT
jgi:hypothetical protein